MGGTPAMEYGPNHLAFHMHMLSGMTSSGGTWPVVESSEAPGDSVQGIIWDLLTINTCGDNPYHGVTLYSATSSGQPFQTFLDKINVASCYLTSIHSFSSDTTTVADWATDFATLYGTMSCNFPEPSMTSPIAALEAGTWGRLLREMANLNAAYSQVNAVFTSSRILAQALMVRDVGRSLDEQEAKLLIEQERMAFERDKQLVESARIGATQTIEIDTNKMSRMVELDLNKFKAYASVAELYKVASELKTTYERTYIEDSVQFDLQDTMWDANLLKFSEQALGSIGGLNPMPEKPSPILQALNLFAGVFSAVAPFAFD